MQSCRSGDLVFDTTLSVCLSVCVCAWVQIAAATLSGNSLRQTVRIHCASVHQAEKLVAAFLRFTGVIAGLAESNGSLPPGLWLTSPAGMTAKNRDQLRNHTLGNRVLATFLCLSGIIGPETERDDYNCRH